MLEIIAGFVKIFNGFIELLFNFPVFDLPFTYGNLFVFLIISGILWKVVFGGSPIISGKAKNKSKTTKEVGE